MPLRYLDEPGPSLGMIRDEPSWLLPRGALYDARNVVFDQPGMARMRMGSTALVSGSQTAFATSLGFVDSEDSTRIEELYGHNGKDATLSIISKTTGAQTSLGTFGPVGITGRPAHHFGFIIFPVNATSVITHGGIIAAGQTSTTTFVNGVGSGLTAGNPQVTLGGADTTTNIKVGAIVRAAQVDGLGVNWNYWGRVISIDTSKIFTVWPNPVITGGVGITGLTTAPARSSTAGGVCATSFQNRLLYGNTMDIGAANPVRNDRRVIYSLLPTESSGGNTGATFIESGPWPALNYFNVPGSDPIVAMEPVAGNQLLILTATHPVVFSGSLVTQTVTSNPTITFDLSDINVNASCLSDLSVQRTPKGIVWAGAGGIYAWDGREPVDLTTGTINTYWRGLVRGSSFAIHGAAWVRGYYLISGTSGGSLFSLMGDLTGKQPKWTRASGVGTDIFLGAARPTDSSQVFALRWWDQAGAAPSMTNGQTLRLESMLNPYTAGSTTLDADGAVIPVSVQTRTITGDAETQKTFLRGTIRSQQSSTTAAMLVKAQSVIDAAEFTANSSRTLGSLSNTSVLTITNATNANPIAVTTSANHGLQTDDFVDIDGVTGNTNANGRWRIAVTGNTTFTLVGGIGNGAFGGSPTCKKLTETDFAMSPVNKGQGVSIAITGNPNNFEYHGARLAILEQPAVMSA